MKTLILPFIALVATLASCDKDNPTVDPVDPTPVVTTSNPTALLTDEAKISLVKTLKTPAGITDGSVLELDYTLPYYLDEAIDAELTGLTDLVGFMNKYMFDVKLGSASMNYDTGCSAYQARTANGEWLTGRSFDYCHKNSEGGEDPITAIVVKTTPEDGYKSISIMDSYWLGSAYQKGFYTDNSTDLSLLLAAPYLQLDGMNEKGLTVSVLKLDGQTTYQEPVSKKQICTSVAMRMILDRCATVQDAIDSLSNYAMTMVTPGVKGSFHLFISDNTGRSVVVEYVSSDPETVTPSTLEITEIKQVTNFYVAESLKDNQHGGLSDHGRARYNTLVNTLTEKSGVLTYDEGMNLLKAVAQDANPDQPTSHTQWSACYNQTTLTVDVAFLQNWANTLHYSL